MHMQQQQMIQTALLHSRPQVNVFKASYVLTHSIGGGHDQYQHKHYRNWHSADASGLICLAMSPTEVLAVASGNVAARV